MLFRSDVASAIITVLKAALRGEADLGVNGLCRWPCRVVVANDSVMHLPADIVGHNDVTPSMREITSTVGNVCIHLTPYCNEADAPEKLLYEKGLATEPGCRPYSDSFIGSLREMFGMILLSPAFPVIDIFT